MFLLRTMAIDVLSVGAVVAPIVLIAQAVLTPSRPAWQRFAAVAFALCVVAIFSVTGMPTVLYHSVDFSFIFVPFAGFAGNPAQYILNVILFVPIGFFAPLLWNCFHSLRAITLFGFCLSLFIEMAQIFTFRVTDINDLCTNTLGGIVGFLLAKAVSRLRKRSFPRCARTRFPGAIEPVFMVVFIFLLQYFLQPFVSEPLWKLIL